jgi:alpha-glucosidase
MSFPPSWASALHHDGSPIYVSPANPTLGGSVTLRLRTGLSAPIERVLLRTTPDGEQMLTPMRLTMTDQASSWWEAELVLAAPSTGYRFYLQTDGGSYWLNAAGLGHHTPTDVHDFQLLASYLRPAWLDETVFYQIFPDRFADGDPASNVPDEAYLYQGQPVVARRWGELPSRAHGQFEFFGGDLSGIVQHLDYVSDLGANALYLNPIFTAPSNHKYDVADYAHVDPHLGGEAGLIELRRALDKRGMRVILDIVPNHCGATHPWFTAAQTDPDAPEAEFFSFRRHPDQYEAWLGIPTLPKLNYRSEKLRDRMYAGPDAIMRHWLRPPYRIDGWRIDVANMLARQGESQLGHKIGRGLRRAVKAEAPDAYLLGENFYDGTPHLQGNELDATMNYSGFTLPLLGWLTGADVVSIQLGASPGPLLPTEALAAQWRSYMATIPWQVARQQFNLLGSHDTPRILTTLGDDRRLLRLAVALLFLFPGVPSVYYGDEIGMTGGGDPDCRRCMVWDEAAWDRELRQYYQALIRLRRTAPALKYGGFQVLYAAGETIAFQREAPGQRLIAVARRQADGLHTLLVSHAGLGDGATLRELLSGAVAQVQGGHLSIAGLAGPGVQIWEEIG